MRLLHSALVLAFARILGPLSGACNPSVVRSSCSGFDNDDDKLHGLAEIEKLCFDSIVEHFNWRAPGHRPDADRLYQSASRTDPILQPQPARTLQRPHSVEVESAGRQWLWHDHRRPEVSSDALGQQRGLVVRSTFARRPFTFRESGNAKERPLTSVHED